MKRFSPFCEFARTLGLSTVILCIASAIAAPTWSDEPKYYTEREEAVLLSERGEQAKEIIRDCTESIKAANKAEIGLGTKAGVGLGILFCMRADAQMMLEDYVMAFEDYSRAIELGAIPKSKMRLSRAFAALGKQDEHAAIEDALLASKSELSECNANLFLAMLHARSKDAKVKNPAKAMALAESAAEVATEESVVGVERALASAYAANGNFEKAAERQLRAIHAHKGDKIPSLFKKELDAYKSGKEMPLLLR